PPRRERPWQLLPPNRLRHLRPGFQLDLRVPARRQDRQCLCPARPWLRPCLWRLPRQRVLRGLADQPCWYMRHYWGNAPGWIAGEYCIRLLHRRMAMRRYRDLNLRPLRFEPSFEITLSYLLFLSFLFIFRCYWVKEISLLVSEGHCLAPAV